MVWCGSALLLAELGFAVEFVWDLDREGGSPSRLAMLFKSPLLHSISDRNGYNYSHEDHPTLGRSCESEKCV